MIPLTKNEVDMLSKWITIFSNGYYSTFNVQRNSPFDEILPKLIELNFIKTSQRTYWITEEGIEYISNLHSLNQL